MRQYSEEEIETQSLLSRTDFYRFCRWMFLRRKGFQWIRARHHKVICDALERVFNGECKRLIINIPPRYSKTEIAVVNFIAWTLGHYPDSEYIHTSYSSRLAGNNTWQVRELVQSSEYKRIFPNVTIRSDSAARDEWRTTSGGCVYAAGSGGTITGYGAGKHRKEFGGCIIIDDPHKADEAHSDTIRSGVIDWFQNTLESRKNGPDTPVILVMQRLHEMDLSGWLLSGGNGEHWEHISLPALDEANKSALWPEKHSVEKLMQMKASNSYVFEGQYQQNPFPPGGGILKKEWWRKWPKEKNLPVCDHIFVSWDTAFSTEDQKNSAFSAMTKWGIWWDEQTDRYNVLLVGAWDGQVDYPTLQTKALEINKEDRPDRFLIEKKASGISLIQSLRRVGIPIYAYNPDRDKVSRAYAVQGMLESGQIWYPEGRDWAERVIDMAAKFPNGAPPSADYCDTCTQAWLYLRNGWWVSGHPDTPETDDDDDLPRFTKKRLYG